MALGAALLATPTAEAKDLNGRLGIGGARTLAGVQGLDVIYWAGRLGLGGTVNLLFASPEAADTSLQLNLSLGVLYPVISREHAELSIGGRASFGIVSGEGGSTQVSIEGPLRLSWYLTDHLSLFGEVGVVVEIVPETRRLDAAGGAGSDGFGIVIGSTTLTGGGGFTVLF
jgi:hypothetical protein